MSWMNQQVSQNSQGTGFIGKSYIFLNVFAPHIWNIYKKRGILNLLIFYESELVANWGELSV